MVDSLLKYKFYKQFGIDPQHVAPYREEWLEAVLQLVPRAPPPLVSQVCHQHLGLYASVIFCAANTQVVKPWPLKDLAGF
jgi:hypothetical protein